MRCLYLAFSALLMALTCSDAWSSESQVLSDYQHWANNPAMFTWGGGTNDFASKSARFHLLNLTTGENTGDITGNKTIALISVINGFDWFKNLDERLKFWQLFGEELVPPHFVLRFAPDMGQDAKDIDFAKEQFVLGGLLVKEEAKGFAFRSEPTAETGGRRTTRWGEDGYQSWFCVYESFEVQRGGEAVGNSAFTFHGTVNLDIAANKILRINTDEGLGGDLPTLAKGAKLCLHSTGSLEVNALDARGSVTIDYSELAVTSSNRPFILGDLIIDENTTIVLPKTQKMVENTPYRLCSGRIIGETSKFQYNGEMLVSVVFEGNAVVYGTGRVRPDLANAEIGAKMFMVDDEAVKNCGAYWRDVPPDASGEGGKYLAIDGDGWMTVKSGRPRNGLSSYLNYWLGLDATAEAAPYLKVAADSPADGINLVVSGISPRNNDHIVVMYDVQSATELGAWDSASSVRTMEGGSSMMRLRDSETKRTVTVPLPESGVRYYRLRFME